MNKNDVDQYQPVIGLEIHAQLNTKSKLFSGDKNLYGKDGNENISEITLAHPGTLPMLNEAVFPLAIKLGLSCHSKITRVNYFDRKNYFYPDLPKGYQITQDSTPICVGGYLDLVKKNHTIERVQLNRMHIEEDAGKSKHTKGLNSHINFNRAGVPLLEIVTEPCFHDPEIAGIFLTEIRKRIRWLGVGNGNMEEGSLRCDVNVSIRKRNSTELNTKVEIKNLNSIRNVQRTIVNEVERQKNILREGGVITPDTRNFDAATGQSTLLRSKESLNDYRYFPDPDITPYVVSEAMIEKIREEMPVLPEIIYHDIIHQHEMSYKEADYITHDKTTSNYFVATLALIKAPKKIIQWMMGTLNTKVKSEKTHLSKIKIKPTHLADLILHIENKTITHSMATQQVFPYLWKHGGKVADAIQKLGLQTNLLDQNLDQVVDEVLDSLTDKVIAYKKGKKGLLQFFVGQCMAKLKGKADAGKLKVLIEKKLLT